MQLVAERVVLRFRRDGVLRDEAMVDGVYVDHLVMSLLEDEYRQLVGGEGR